MDGYLNLRGTYSSSLRTRSIWKVIGPVLTASSESIQEEQVSQNSDFVFQQSNNTPSLQVLLLSPSSLTDPEKQNTGLRLRHFATSDPTLSSTKAIAFLLSEEAFTTASGKTSLNGLLALQVFMFENLTTPLPVIPSPDAPSLLPSIHEYMKNLDDIPMATSSLADSVALLSHATSEQSGTLGQQTANILSDLFPSLGKLSVNARTHEGQALLADYFGETTGQNIARFWREDNTRE